MTQTHQKIFIVFFYPEFELKFKSIWNNTSIKLNVFLKLISEAIKKKMLHQSLAVQCSYTVLMLLQNKKSLKECLGGSVG